MKNVGGRPAKVMKIIPHFWDNSANEGLIHSDFALDVTNLTVGKDRALTGA